MRQVSVQVQTVEQFYSSGEYWQDKLNEKSDFKVPLAIRALDEAGFRITPGLRAAEIGCGNGAFLFPLAHALDALIGSFSLTGFDIAPNAVDLAKARASETGETRLTFAVKSAAEIDERFDIVFIMDVVEHVADPYSFLRSVRKIAPVIVLHLPIEQSLAHNIIRRASTSYRRFHHLHFFSQDSMRVLVQESGLEIISMRYTAASSEVLHLHGGPATQVARRLRYYASNILPDTMSMLTGGSLMLVMKPTD